MHNNHGKNTFPAMMGGLSGAVFFIGLILAIQSDHFLPVFFVTLGITSFVGSLASGNADGSYGGFQGCVFLFGCAFCSVFGWWPWILGVVAISSVLGALHVPMTAALGAAFQNMSKRPQPVPNPAPSQPYSAYQEGYPAERASTTYEEGHRQQYDYQPMPSPSNYSDQPQAQYPQEMPPMQQ